jgi:hypothetical protein
MSGPAGISIGSEPGFSLAEFMIAALILLVASTAAFGVLAETQQLAAFQAETQGVIESCRIAMDTVERVLRQAGNDPHGLGIEGLQIAGAAEVRVRSDITGSAGVGSDRGDPDGDTLDSGEDVTIRYNAGNRSLEIGHSGNPPQPVASSISGFALEFFDAAGGLASVGAHVRRVSIQITGAGEQPDPKTGQVFSMRLKSDLQIATRQ